MIDYKKFLNHLNNAGLQTFAAQITPMLETYFKNLKNADFPKWLTAINALPKISDLQIDMNSDTVTIDSEEQFTPARQNQIRENLMHLHPWRKGPFELFGVKIDTEWRSDFKWQRLIDKIEPLDGKTVLDVGCGNGYHCYRMLGAGAKAVVGIDPFLLFCTQFQAINKYVRTDKTAVLPFGIDDMPVNPECFDTVFSMGVLYHRKDPAEHIERLKGFLKPGGQLVLETLIIEDQNTDLLIPEGRYAKMRNVWNIPSTTRLIDWLNDAGLKNAQIIDVTKTTTDEQRPTEWMTFESLPDYLDKDNPNKTIEGHPAPIRAIAIATKT